MKNLFDRINQILAEWDSLNLGEDIATDEYRKYIPLIKSRINNRVDLIACLENIFINSLESGYEKLNVKHRHSLDIVVDKIMHLNF